MNCAVCGNGSARRILRKGDVDILRCSTCGLGFWVPPAAFQANRLYDETYFSDPGCKNGYDSYAALEISFRQTFARRIARIPRPAAGALVLDVGAAFGYAAAEAELAGWVAIALEVSHAAARRGAERVPGRVVAADSLAMPFAARTFDAVTMWDVLEHLRDPHAAIAEVARVTRPGGHFVLTTGDAGSVVARLCGSRWHLYNLPEHLFFYTRRSLDILLAAHGFRIVQLRTEPSVYTLGYLVERMRKSLLGRTQSAGKRWPGSGLRVSVNLFDIVTVAAIRC